MSQCLAFPGESVYNGFRKAEIARRLGLDAHEINAIYIHFVSLREPLREPLRANEPVDLDVEALKKLLPKANPCSDNVSNLNPSSKEFFVVPRTLSPWSSKATNIAHVSHFESSIKRIERAVNVVITSNREVNLDLAHDLLYDRMTQVLLSSWPDPNVLFAEPQPAPAAIIDLHGGSNLPHDALQATNKAMGLALDDSEIEYLIDAYSDKGPVARNPRDVELCMFSQVTHKNFNASWTIDGIERPQSLFSMIRSTHTENPKYTISAYSDNAAVICGPEDALHLAPNPASGEWNGNSEQVHHVIKVETHNHPTAISPFPGAATGSGGEIRDEGSVGRGSSPRAGLCGFSVSDLNIPNHKQPWERNEGHPHHVASSLKIMLDAPIGSSNYNNEFGRPALTGYFRTLLTKLSLEDGKEELRGYHKPIMLAGGVGTVRPQHSIKNPNIVHSKCFAVVLGGPAMLIGVGGGSASSVTSTEGSAELDFASVQRGNAEVQRRAQEVINACNAMGNGSPILFVHDVGAGGLSNALPELCHDAGLGGSFELRDVDNAGCSSPMEIWCNEAQERYVLAIASDKIDKFTALADRERARYSIVGTLEGNESKYHRLILSDSDSKEVPTPIDLPMDTLFGKTPKLHQKVQSRKIGLQPFDAGLRKYLPTLQTGFLEEAVRRVLQLPSVASKQFLITIGDRTVGGLTARDQLVGPWQVPVADVAVTGTCLKAGIKTGAAMAMGEKPTIALINPAASARMAIAESLCNIAAADLQDGLERIRLSANWMSAIKHPGEGAAIYEAVEAATDLCKDLKISIPVGKDSTSMKMSWRDRSTLEAKEVIAPLSLVVSAFSISRNIINTWTPQLRRPEELDIGETVLLMVDLAAGHKALGGSALAQVFGQIGDEAPDLRDVQLLKDYFDAIEQLHESGVVLAYHDSSDGGIFTAIAEMMFAGRCGVQLLIDEFCRNEPSDVISTLFTEELAAVFQVRKRDITNFMRCFATCGPPSGLIKNIGRVTGASSQNLTVYHGATLVYRKTRSELQQLWSSTSHQMQRIRDNPSCADAEFASILNDLDPGLSYNLTFDATDDLLPFKTKLTDRLFTQRPRVAILREQGCNGAPEMAFAFMTASFTAVDVHMSDLLTGRVSLSSFQGLAAVGGFSYGDVLGAGRGWAASVFMNRPLREEFKAFFGRPDTFTVGVCNGCQFLTQLAAESDVIPGTAAWPLFLRNTSEQFEARYSMVEIKENPRAPSVFLFGMAGSQLPISVSHGEGRAHFAGAQDQHQAAKALFDSGMVPLRYLDNDLKPTETYPFNPNGSPNGLAGVMSSDGRVLAMMPHPERTVASGIGSWIPDGRAKAWGEVGPWARLFKSARRWVG
ncbi:uncharacterized protein KY384_005461 [Bacidia gigantensis]|uniref:uncharacterized protein n=1 Tax=Bacidia gigantensis TaxID=2732470 RepID=UPI001D0537AE|nr:uncharacterized protein KY384_005461 [Bacidia gigantensis]KAG8529979.1 hypothetical protein KY384_005461 [Bacidia gigantensis]